MDLGPLALVVAAGLLGPALASVPRLTIPLVVGELLAGIVIGHTGFRWVDADSQSLKFLGEIGFAMLMLIAGTHLPLRTPGLAKALRSGIVAMLLAFAFAVPLAFGLSKITPLHDMGIFVVLLATSSAAIVMPVLGEGGAIEGNALRAVAWVALADVATVVAIPLVLTDGRTLQVILGSLAVAAVAALMYFVVRHLNDRGAIEKQERMSLRRGWALHLRLSLVALFGLAWLATSLDSSVLVAGFSIGVVLALIGEPRSLARELIGVGEGFLIPVFFVTLGARLDVRALFSDPENLGLLGVLIVAVIGLHLAVALVTRVGSATGLLASAQLGVPSAVATLGLQNGALKPGEGAAIVSAALLSVGVSALGASRLRGEIPKAAQ